MSIDSWAENAIISQPYDISEEKNDGRTLSAFHRSLYLNELDEILDETLEIVRL